MKKEIIEKLGNMIFDILEKENVPHRYGLITKLSIPILTTIEIIEKEFKKQLTVIENQSAVYEIRWRKYVDKLKSCKEQNLRLINENKKVMRSKIEQIFG